ncbi:hypothetical protein ANN_06678 [Periplaneta americana]|uniref:Uncharacterized protein n=1 Tax=Periplaneta americana TaxID=6978 RepID=A0ABQ8TE74_PERAM|nr:hypothetical protein ANN_06678 [Periplaneta americana]
MAGLCEGGNEPPGSLEASNVDGIGDDEMVFGEITPRIRHILPDIRLMFGKTSEKPNQVISPSGNRTHARAQLWIGRQAPQPTELPWWQSEGHIDMDQQAIVQAKLGSGENAVAESF